MTKKEIQSDYGSSVNSEILVTLLGSKISITLLNFFSTTAVFYILTVISALLVLWQSLYFFATGRHIRLVVILAKTVAAIAAAIALGITIACTIVAAYYAKEYIGSSYHLGIDAGIIVMTLFSICASFCPTSLVKKAKKVRRAKVESFSAAFEEQF